jgi:hypothetical protein
VCERERERERDFCRAANFWVSGLKKNCSEEHGFNLKGLKTWEEEEEEDWRI